MTRPKLVRLDHDIKRCTWWTNNGAGSLHILHIPPLSTDVVLDILNTHTHTITLFICVCYNHENVPTFLFVHSASWSSYWTLWNRTIWLGLCLSRFLLSFSTSLLGSSPGVGEARWTWPDTINGHKYWVCICVIYQPCLQVSGCYTEHPIGSMLGTGQLPRFPSDCSRHVDHDTVSCPESVVFHVPIIHLLLPSLSPFYVFLR